MINIDGVLVSDEIASQHFVCDLEKCKGACCVEGELGAPLEKVELKRIDEVYGVVEEYLSEQGKAAINEQGRYLFDEDSEYSTPTIDGKECAYSIYDDRGILKCGFEKAFEEGKSDFRKPVSCHLYPARISRIGDGLAINYHKWEICNPACHLGAELKIPLYKFLKVALTRKFGKKWYNKLEDIMKSFVSSNR